MFCHEYMLCYVMMSLKRHDVELANFYGRVKTSIVPVLFITLILFELLITFSDPLLCVSSSSVSDAVLCSMLLLRPRHFWFVCACVCVCLTCRYMF